MGCTEGMPTIWQVVNLPTHCYDDNSSSLLGNEPHEGLNKLLDSRRVKEEDTSDNKNELANGHGYYY